MAPINPSSSLDDLNDIQLMHAQTGGLSQPFESDSALSASIDQFLKSGKLVFIKNCDYYCIDSLKHSYPYLTPEAAEALHDIGIEFQKEITKSNALPCRLLITSMLRTAEGQKKLKRYNRNASPNSAHLYGTTFDITYNKFVIDDSIQCVPKEIPALSQALITLRQQCRILVRKEFHQSCFHITVAAYKKQND